MNEPRQETVENTQTGDDTPASNLIQIETERPEHQARDINAKIDRLDTSLESLNAELDRIRDSVDEGLEKLGDNDLDLTSKVSDTYKRLGELDNTYKSLSRISANINQEIGRLTGDISRVASESSAELEKLEATSQVHNTYLTRQNETLASRVDTLASEARDTSSRLQLSIKEVQHTLLTSEQKLIADINELAETTGQRDEQLAGTLDVANSEIALNAARIIKLNKVDEALEKRASKLERTTGDLDAELKQLEEASEFLGIKTEMLSESIEKIIAHTDLLQRASDDQATRIGSLQQRFSNLAADLLDLGDTESKHFRLSLLVLLLVAVAAAGIYLKQDGDSSLLFARMLERTQIVNADIDTVGMQLDTVGEQLDASTDQLGKQIAVLNTDLNEKIVMIDDKVNDVSRQLAHLDDQAKSLNGRLSADSPLDNFGGDNIVHGNQWLRELQPGGYMIQLATVRDSRQMYEITQDYSSYLNQPVAYYTDADNRHVMLYGRFDSKAAAAAALRRLPYRIDNSYPSVRTVDSVKQAL